MAIKTAYKPKKSVENIPVENNSAAIDENIPKVEINSEAQEPIAALSVEAETAAAVAAINEATKVDDAALALKKQLDAVRQNEELQRQQAAMMAALQPPTREQLLDQWKKQGMSETEAAFLQENPALIDNPRLTQIAAAEASKRYARGTEAHLKETRDLFHEALNIIKTEEANPAVSMQEPTPQFFRPPPQKPSPPTELNQSAIVSAPVSREVPSGGPRPDFETDPRRVTLTADEQEIARASGISLQEYARQKIRLKRELAAGLRQNG